VSPQILLVEDGVGDARLAREAFRGINSSIGLHVAGDGVEAMAFLRREGAHAHAARPDIILLDLNLPKLGGREVLAQIKQDESLRSIPTIILSTSDKPEDIDYCYQHYANCYIRKPERWDEFDDLVKRVNDFWLINKHRRSGR
jgi:two-component system, chemotaxis family, response regulator Rcp1